MYRSLFQEIDAVDLEKKSLKPKEIKPVDESAGEVVIGELSGNLLRHRILIEDYLGRLDEINLKIGDADASHKVDHENDDITQGELKKACEKHAAIIIALSDEHRSVETKLRLLTQIYESEIVTEFPTVQEFRSVVLRDGNQIVGLDKMDGDKSASIVAAILFGAVHH